MQEHFLPFFESAGYQALAVSLRCHGTSGGPAATGCTLSTHVEDVQDLIRTLPRAPVLLGGLSKAAVDSLEEGAELH